MKRRDFVKTVGLGSASATLLSLPTVAHALANPDDEVPDVLVTKYDALIDTGETV